MVFGYLSYFLAFKAWMYGSEESSHFLDAPSDTLKLDHAPTTILASLNANVEYPKREDFLVAQERFGRYSQWMKPSEAKFGFYACGLTLTNEAKLMNGDNSAVNTLAIYYCRIGSDPVEMYGEKLNVGEFGTDINTVLCPKDHYISAVEVYREDYQASKDWSSINGFYLYCTYIRDGKIVKEIDAHAGSWGSRQKKIEAPGKFLCGAQVAYDSKNGVDGDRIGLDGLLLKFCNWNDSKDSLSSVLEGTWGEWWETVLPKTDFLACGFRTKIDQEDTDRSGVSGLALTFCNVYDWSEQNEIVIIPGWYGKWNPAQLCKPGQLIDRLWVYNQDPQGPKIDDLSVVGLYARCSLPSNRTQTYDIYDYIQVNATWHEAKDLTPNYICGARARFDLTQKGNDATSVTGLRIKICENTNQNDYTNLVTSNYGQWQPPIMASPGKFACGIKMRAIDFYPGIIRLDSMSMVYCSYNNWSDSESKLGGEKEYYTNIYQEFICPSNYFIYSIRLKNASIKVKEQDVTSVNGIEINCSDGAVSQTLKYELRQAGEWSSYKFDGSLICGERHLLEPFTIEPKASGLYGLKLKLCPAWFDSGKFIDIAVGEWGNWLETKLSEKNYYGCGVRVRISGDYYQQWDAIYIDAMGIMGLQITYCHKDDWNNKRTVADHEVFTYGEYRYAACPEGAFIIGASAKFQKPQGSGTDDVAVSGLKIICSKSRSGAEKFEVAVHESAYGDWLQPVVAEGFLCGSRARIDKTLQFTRGSDATGLNSISFKFC